MTPDDRDALLAFLQEGVPPNRKGHLDDWKKRAVGYGPEAPAIFLDLLKRGRPVEQDSSLVALRLYGYQAWADGQGKALHSRVRAPDSHDWRIIRPERLDE